MAQIGAKNRITNRISLLLVGMAAGTGAQKKHKAQKNLLTKYTVGVYS